MISRKGMMPRDCMAKGCPNGEFKNVQTLLETIMKINCRTFRIDDEVSGVKKGIKCVWRNGATVEILEPDVPHHECHIFGKTKAEYPKGYVQKSDVISGQSKFQEEFQYAEGGRRV